MPWPADVAALAGALAAEATAAPGAAWCWLDEWSGRSLLGIAAEVRVAERGREREFLEGLRDDAGDAAGDPADDPAASSRGMQRWVVALGYEFGQALLGLDPAPDDAAPAVALRLDAALVLDHARGVTELRAPSEAEIDDWLAHYGAVLTPHASTLPGESALPIDMSAEHLERPERAAGARRGDAETAAGWRKIPAEYQAEVEACRAAIRDGDAYVLCLTDTAETPAAGVDPLDLYLRLRRDRDPAVRGGVLVAGERALVSASPERFLSVTGSRIATHPIKGTRPRGATPEEDARLAAELGADPKERAENLMIVDLMRNDLSRVCEPGTVATTGFLRVETHPYVHQLVSTVEGRLTPGLDAIDAIEACFPGGSMTGAPKRRAVEILRDLEGGSRGLYSGCFGWLGADGDGISEAELAMTIRSVELRGLGTLTATARVGAGGGITIDSDPAREEAERRLKAAPLLRALSAVASSAVDPT